MVCLFHLGRRPPAFRTVIRYLRRGESVGKRVRALARSEGAEGGEGGAGGAGAPSPEEAAPSEEEPAGPLLFRHCFLCWLDEGWDAPEEPPTPPRDEATGAA